MSAGAVNGSNILFFSKYLSGYSGMVCGLTIQPYVLTEGMKEQIKSYPDKIEVSLKTTILDIVKMEIIS